MNKGHTGVGLCIPVGISCVSVRRWGGSKFKKEVRMNSTLRRKSCPIKGKEAWLEVSNYRVRDNKMGAIRVPWFSWIGKSPVGIIECSSTRTAHADNAIDTSTISVITSLREPSSWINVFPHLHVWFWHGVKQKAPSVLRFLAVSDDSCERDVVTFWMIKTKTMEAKEKKLFVWLWQRRTTSGAVILKHKPDRWCKLLKCHCNHVLLKLKTEVFWIRRHYSHNSMKALIVKL